MNGRKFYVFKLTRSSAPERIVGSEFGHMDYAEAIRVLGRANEKFEFPVKWSIGLQSEHERYQTEKYAKKPVIALNYPKAIKAFYMQVNGDGRTVAAMDILAPGIGEIIGGNPGARDKHSSASVSGKLRTILSRAGRSCGRIFRCVAARG